jgi:hypothetical protein
MLREDVRSLALTRAALERLVGDWPRLLPFVQGNIATMRRAESCSERYLSAWEELLNAGPEMLCSVILASTDEAQVLRSIHPLAGLLSPAERTDIIRATGR